jgi:hypothetical protein
MPLTKGLHRRQGLGKTGRAAALASALVGAVAAAGAAPTAPAFAQGTGGACSTLEAAVKIVTEPLSAAASQSPGWVPLQANGWTVFAPNSNWTLTASDAGADVNSPDNQRDASLITWYSLGVPWTFKTLGAKFVGHLTHVQDLCRTAVARSASGQSQATELAGDLGRQKLRAVLVLSMLTPTTETYVGESRYLYTPAAQWDMANARTLALIIRRAIESPQSLGP